MGREQNECGNHSHGHLPPEEFRALAEPLANRLADAARTAARQLRGEPGYAGSALAEVEVWPRVPDLDMNVMAAASPSRPGRVGCSSCTPGTGCRRTTMRLWRTAWSHSSAKRLPRARHRTRPADLERTARPVTAVPVSALFGPKGAT